MALTVEDGSIVADADSYVNRDSYIAYALARGVVVADDVDADIELVKAAQFVDSHESRMKGTRVSRDQNMAFPRSDVTIDGWEWSAAEIPRTVLLCQMSVALDIHAGVDPYNPPQQQFKTRVAVAGAVDVSYAAPAAVKLSKDSTWLALLNALLRNNGMSMVVSRG